ncbi:GlcNAc-transferase family protein, partial [Raoultella ornithinolytica]|uniref:GlcNAc-transferase family protein n=2 Tax=Enterobacteriaceae TaxID=543 RepID=UPI003F1E4379
YVSRLIFREFNPQGIPMLTSTPFTATEPVRGSYLAGGFIFTHGDFVSTVPNDPQIFFAGEEIAMAVRAFTYGYDIYHPHKPLLWHFYQRKEHSKVWGDHSNEAKAQGVVDKAWWERDNISKKRVRTLLGLETEDAA